LLSPTQKVRPVRRSHVYERSAPRVARQAYQEVAAPEVAARTIAAQLGNLIDKADRAGIMELGGLLEQARIIAENAARG
jgi:hypothetical protein